MYVEYIIILAVVGGFSLGTTVSQQMRVCVGCRYAKPAKECPLTYRLAVHPSSRGAELQYTS